MEKLISIIVPVYNVKKYLSRCIESILCQTYKKFELILVDDGSLDGSGAICELYKQKDKRIKVIHKSNGGVSSARNEGIETARGEYIMFVDSDDWVSQDCLEKLIKPMLRGNAQMVVGGIELREFTIHKQIIEEQLLDLHNIDYERGFEFFVRCSSLSRGPYAKLYEKRIIDENNIRYDEKIKWGEDAIFLYEYWLRARKLYIISDIVYYYNRLVFTSATRNMCQDKVGCRIALQKKFDKLMNALMFEGYEKIIQEYKYVNFFGGLGDFCLQQEKPMTETITFYEQLEPWDCTLERTDTDDVRALKENNFEKLFQLYKPPKRSALRKLVKTLYDKTITKAKIYRLERYRDGLKKLKD